MNRFDRLSRAMALKVPEAPGGRVWQRWELTDDTAPAAIAAAQREAVREAREALGPGATVEELSAAAVLPVWTVRRRLEEITNLEAA
ncbi:unnamed protein product [Gemmataceae bacterium]|nr:unnamed protein product [Gemmataceae bacterium]VTT96545.1 unnamed protein product [Gemmataceae bacterium]